MRDSGAPHEQASRVNLGDIPPPSRTFAREIEAILDQARWAPSGDNTQPWRFEIIDDSRLIVHLLVGRMSAEDFYTGLDERSIFLVGGILLETMRIAATTFQ